jgi:hypothetical protein
MSNAEHTVPRDADAPVLVKVRFPLEASDREMGVESESLWARDLGGRQYMLDNIPFYVYGVSLGDIVSATETPEGLMFRETTSPGGHSTYRVLVSDEAGFEGATFEIWWRQLEALGCTREVARRKWIAIDVPRAADVDAVYRVLERGEADEVWSFFEEGHCGHPL